MAIFFKDIMYASPYHYIRITGIVDDSPVNQTFISVATLKSFISRNRSTIAEAVVELPKVRQNSISMSSMFSNCTILQSLNLHYFDTSNIIDMNNMFMNCNSLTSLDLSSFDTSAVVNMQNMFYICSNVVDLNLTSFRTHNVIDMSGMFSVCPNIISLDLSSFDTSAVVNMQNMFYGCNKLTTVYCRTEEDRLAFMNASGAPVGIDFIVGKP